MTLPLTSPEDIINDALARIGYRGRITNIYDGSPAANAALNVYAQTRDEMLRQNDWGFAERTVALALLKQAPQYGYIPPIVWSTAYPPLPWLFEYTYPPDCLKIRAVKGTPLFVPNFDPQPNVFNEPNDYSLVPPAKVIVCNVPSAILIYTGQVTDMTQWDTDFVEAVSAALGRRLAPTLVDLNATKLAAGDEGFTRDVAEMEQE